jgi:23S rRNA (pseudouridine1915-N3)-methyltransferase
MGVIRIITFGKRKEVYLSGAYLEFEKRLSRYKIEYVFCKKESDLAKLTQGFTTYYLDSRGAKCSSEGFSSLLIIPKVCFVIGPAQGFSQTYKPSLSFSDMTFNHELVYVLLLEQIYRGFSILGDNNYHK